MINWVVLNELCRVMAGVRHRWGNYRKEETRFERHWARYKGGDRRGRNSNRIISRRWICWHMVPSPDGLLPIPAQNCILFWHWPSQDVDPATVCCPLSTVLLQCLVRVMSSWLTTINGQFSIPNASDIPKINVVLSEPSPLALKPIACGNLNYTPPISND